MRNLASSNGNQDISKTESTHDNKNNKSNKNYFWKILAKKSRGAETTLCQVGFTHKNAG